MFIVKHINFSTLRSARWERVIMFVMKHAKMFIMKHKCFIQGKSAKMFIMKHINVSTLETCKNVYYETQMFHTRETCKNVHYEIQMFHTRKTCKNVQYETHKCFIHVSWVCTILCDLIAMLLFFLNILNWQKSIKENPQSKQLNQCSALD